jgi:dTDP-4-dehydrorhamnose 3,5-epimerase
MDIVASEILPAVRIVTPRRFVDERGFFSEVWKANAFAEAGIEAAFVQDNHSLSRQQGVVRGLHFQTGRNAQAKLVRCIRGAILDVAVDVRHGSPTFGRHVAIELSAQNWRQLFIPVGFAHGFCTLQPETEVIYKVTAPYDPAADNGVAHDDPDLGIAWPIAGGEAILSEKDRAQPRLKDLPAYFPYADFPDRVD